MEQPRITRRRLVGTAAAGAGALAAGHAPMEEEDLAAERMGAYDNETFWAELIERLSERDLVAKHGQSASEKMTIEERLNPSDETVSTPSGTMHQAPTVPSGRSLSMKVPADGREYRQAHEPALGGSIR